MIANVRRCVNIDWLEVDALEPANGQDADYFRSHGLVVDEREYGTRVFAQMFTIYGSDHLPFIEIRRKPKRPYLVRRMFTYDYVTELAILIMQPS